MSQRIIPLLEACWKRHPYLRFGEFVEKVEDLAWDIYEEDKKLRHFSRRLMNLPDEYLEMALIRMLL